MEWTHAHTVAATAIGMRLFHLVEKAIEAWGEGRKKPVEVHIHPVIEKK